VKFTHIKNPIYKDTMLSSKKKINCSCWDELGLFFGSVNIKNSVLFSFGTKNSKKQICNLIDIFPEYN